MTKSKRRRALTDEERQAKRAGERKKVEAAIEQLRTSEGWQRWLKVRRHFHRFSFHNQVLIAFQRPGATRVAGFRRWLSLGYAVRKGEHGIYIWAPCPPSKSKLKKWREDGADPNARPRTYFRMVSVFDRSQVEPLEEFLGGPLDLDPPIETIEGDGLAGLFEPLVAFAASIGYTVAVEGIPGAALGFCQPDQRRIVVEPISPTYSANAQVQTEIHELAHALVRAERESDDPNLSYAEEEVVVECVTYAVCSAIGFETAGFSIPYLTTWSKGGEIERFAGLIDRLAKRLEDVALAAFPRVESVEETPTLA